MLPGRTYRPEDLVLIAWKRKWLLALPFLLCAAATVVVTQRLPNQYRADTLILVVPQRVPESYVRSTVSGRIEDRLQSLQQQILSRSRLERIIVDLNLYPELRRTRPFESVVEHMRSAVKVETTARGDAFTVTFVSRDPHLAQAVTARLASLFIEENVREREVLADGTSQFLQTQLDEARYRLIDQEKKLEAYRLKYAGELPSQAPSNLQALQNSQLQVQTIAESILRHRDRLLAIDREIGDLLQGDVAPSAETRAPAASVHDQLEQARARLSELTARLTPAHPDLGRQRRLVEQLEHKVAAENQRTVLAAPPRTPAARARERRLRELRADAALVARDLAAAQAEEQRVRSQMAEYRARLEAAPIRESEMAELTRDHATLQEIYRNLLAKREDSKIAANLERRQVGEQFRVLDPARVPERPFKPDRVRLNLLGALFGLVIGLGLVGLLEYLDSTIKTEDDVLTCLSLPVLAQIPVMSVRPVENRPVFRSWLRAGAGAAALVLIVAVLVWRLGW